MASYGYVRVSTAEQNEDRQFVALRGAGIPAENIYVDKQSGKDFDRPAYSAMLARIEAGDALYIASIDRLGRNVGGKVFLPQLGREFFLNFGRQNFH